MHINSAGDSDRCICANQRPPVIGAIWWHTCKCRLQIARSKHSFIEQALRAKTRFAERRQAYICPPSLQKKMMSASARSIAAHEATPQRRTSRPIPISPPSAEFGNFTAINDGDVPTVTAASLQARASDAALRDYLMWRRVGSPLVSDDGDSPRAKASSRSPSPTTVAFDLTHKLDGEDVLFALDV